ncbi:MBL fold metallo-hydrolase [Ulvibacter antarcticus]|uniref:L-ascorbate metabolism protein UlaG (Beta-lactamase superfamily) n=1 Tax=Ulvibacter antarcticus TaxID=442714 RepID=A0A3L9YW29_9FLAO|nr:MBL fold metallo-hydrolase [Ulvibacter antarcticus]RMA58672.1 L-ascorbate metabolism protein UlaG (beta-lactamase superfamily) [Ulvibacter antarcticus]
MKNAILLFMAIFLVFACKNTSEKSTAEAENSDNQNNKIQLDLEPVLNIIPISHATMILEWDNITIYVDPVGGAKAFEGQKAPDIILVTDIHGDHMNVETIASISGANTNIIAPKAVADKFSEAITNPVLVLNNGDTGNTNGFQIEAIPMYNLRQEALKFHEKGRGNGYVLENDDIRVYISGDTEDIPEMRNLKDIDIAFVCMNLPYTMTVESAANAVLDFNPKKVYPYHFRGTEGLSDVEKFKSIVSESNPDIQVIQLDWYPSE